MKILVLGANGQVGQCLADQLTGTSHQTILSNRSQIDISDFEATRSKIYRVNADVIINASAYTAVDNAEREPDKADLVNNLAVANIAAICADIGSVLIHFSTDYVFDGKASTPYIESCQANPDSVYGKTKLMGELAIQKSGCRYLIFRTGWVFSEYGDNFFKTMLRLGMERDELSIVGDQIGSPTYAQDIAKTVIQGLVRIEKNECEYGIYHYSGDKPCSWYDFAEKIFDEARNYGWSTPTLKSIVTAEYPTPAQRPGYSVLNSRKAIKVFGVLQSDWRSGISSVLRKLQTK